MLHTYLTWRVGVLHTYLAWRVGVLHTYLTWCAGVLHPVQYLPCSAVQSRACLPTCLPCLPPHPQVAESEAGRKRLQSDQLAAQLQLMDLKMQLATTEAGRQHLQVCRRQAGWACRYMCGWEGGGGHGRGRQDAPAGVCVGGSVCGGCMWW